MTATRAFQRIVGIVRRQDETELWKQVRYVAFDAPGLDEVFGEHLAAFRAHIERHRPPTSQPTNTRSAPAWTTSAPRWRASRRSAAGG